MKAAKWTGLSAFVALAALSAWAVLGSTSRGRSARLEPTGNPFRIRVELPGGDELLLPGPPQRVLPANAGAVDLVARLIDPARVAALPRSALEYSCLAREPERWRGVPRFVGLEAERLLGFAPDLVIAHGWQSAETMAILRQAGVPVLILPLPRNWQEIRRALRLCGRALGEQERSEALLRSLDERVARLRERTPASRLRALSYVNLGTGGWVAGAGTTADVLFSLAGLVNAAAERGIEDHATIDLETLLAIDPDVIVVGAESGGAGVPPSESFLRSRPELARLRALRTNRILRLPPRLFTTSSSELVAGAERLVELLGR